MKNFILLVCALLLTNFGIAQVQNSFSLYEMKVKTGGERALAELFDDYWGEAKFKSGGGKY